jgi:hypothetical protein
MVCDRVWNSDHDGRSDCNDPDCLKDKRIQQRCRMQHVFPPHETGWQCVDGKDNDGDGKQDCDDPDCVHDEHCTYREVGVKKCSDGGAFYRKESGVECVGGGH